MYTKGEWKARYSGTKEYPYYVETEDKTIAQIWGLRGTEESKANARLIASAPDLYEALKEAQPFTKMDDRVHFKVAQALAEANEISN